MFSFVSAAAQTLSYLGDVLCCLLVNELFVLTLFITLFNVEYIFIK